MACSVSFSYSSKYNARQECLLSCIKDFYILLLPYGLSNTCNMSTICTNIIYFKHNSTHKTTLHTNLNKFICFLFIRFYSRMNNHSCFHFIFISTTMQVCKILICLFLLIYKCFINFYYGNVLVSNLQIYWEPNSTYKPPYTKRYETLKI
jgi:hypothetical protein